MNYAAQPQPFPAQFLPDSFRLVAEELAQNVKAPYELGLSSLLAAASLVCQFQIRVKMLDGREGPASLSLITIAESGERKTTLDNLVMRPIVEFDDEELTKYEVEFKKYKIQHEIWSAEYGSLLKMLEKMVAKRLDTTLQKVVIAELASKEPAKPKLQKLLYKDVTPEALAFEMHQNSPSVGIISAEAGGVLKSDLLKEHALLNTLWDGADLVVDRRTSESFKVKNGRLTLSLMIQQAPFLEYLENKGDIARGIGFFARGLICFPPSTQGKRYIYSYTGSWQHLPAFHKRLKELLQQQNEAANSEVGLQPITLEFTHEAKEEMVRAYNFVESHINPGGWFADAKDYASKVIENSTRVAAIFHTFSGQTGDITAQTFNSAFNIVLWYGSEFVRLFTNQNSATEADRDIKMIEDWIAKMLNERRLNPMTKSFVMKYGPNSLRSKAKLDFLLPYLASLGRIQLFMHGKTQYFAINENYYGPFGTRNLTLQRPFNI